MHRMAQPVHIQAAAPRRRIEFQNVHMTARHMRPVCGHIRIRQHQLRRPAQIAGSHQLIHRRVACQPGRGIPVLRGAQQIPDIGIEIQMRVPACKRLNARRVLIHQPPRGSRGQAQFLRPAQHRAQGPGGRIVFTGRRHVL